MCYIVGGTPKGADKTYAGCNDRSLPLASRPITMDLELYFGGYSQTWGGAVAFVRVSKHRLITLGRMYLITDSQFSDVVLQENGRTPGTVRVVPEFEQLIQRLNKEYSLPDNCFYDLLLKIGTKRGYPILTLTAQQKRCIGAPSEAYVKTITSGLRQAYPTKSREEICDYLLARKGLAGSVEREKLFSWLAEVPDK